MNKEKEEKRVSIMEKVLDHNLKPLHGIYLLLEKVYPQNHKKDLKSIIELNQGGMKKNFSDFSKTEFQNLTNDKILERLNEKDKEWQKPSNDNMKRKKLLTKILNFSTQEHIEMVDLTKIREMIPINQIKLALSGSSFINFSIKPKMKNMRLTIQGLYLQIFLNYHMKHDLRFKAKVDSIQIEMDNPFARQQIRDENRKDTVLKKRYLEEMEVDEWCKHLLENFFPNIAGIWADHIHVTHVAIFEIVRFCYECGFIDIEDTDVIIKLLYKACISLLKLEEAWIERLADIKKISDTMRASNVTKHFAKCREHMAAILVQILTLYQDDFFIKKFPIDTLSLNLKGIIKDLEHGNYPFFDEGQNEILLFITMNYLSLTVEIESQKGTSKRTKKAIEKIFLYITSENNDCFIESIKQVTAKDLKYFSQEDVILSEYRTVSDNLGYSMRTLLELIARGCFDQKTLKMIKNVENHQNYKEYLKKFVSGDTDLKKIFEEISENMKKKMSDIDFRVSLVKESIPLVLLALADYVTEYFHSTKESKILVKHIFDLLYEISIDNNNCKGQIFKGDGLFHLDKLIKRQNKYVFFFLNKLCDSSFNIAIFLGRGFFSEIIEVFKNFQKRVIEDIEVASKDMIDGDADKPLAEEIDVDDWALYIILNKFFTKLMGKKFLNSREKLQSCFQIQEAVFPTLSTTLMKNFIGYLNTKNEVISEKIQQKETNLKKYIFKDGEESKMVETLEKMDNENSLTYQDLRIIGYQLCFSSLKAFNTACTNAFSTQVYRSVLPFTDSLKEYLFTNKLEEREITEPFGLDTEIIKLLRNMTLIPESNIMIERNFQMEHEDNQVFDKDSTDLADIKKYLARVAQYSKFPDLKEEAQDFVMEGLLPFIYKYATSLLNLTHFEIKNKGKNPYSLGEKKDVDMNDVVFNLKIAEELSQTYKEYNNILVNLMDKNIPNALFGDNDGDRTGIFEQSFVDTREENLNDKLTKYTHALIKCCKLLIRDIENFYLGSRYEKILKGFHDMKKEEFEKSRFKASFEVESQDPNLNKKMEKLNIFIKAFKKMKTEYLERQEGVNLIGFFDKNTENLFGVFSSCIDRAYGLTKSERWNKEKRLAKDIGTNRFWMSRSCFAYIKMLEKLISSSKTAREEFFSFITTKEDLNKNYTEDDEESLSIDRIEKEEIIEGVGKKVKVKKGGRKAQILTGKHDRERLIGMLQRIQHDLVLFLTTSPTQKLIWWNVSLIYEMLCSFFKNLCENNFIEFKEYLGKHIPLTQDSEWNFELKTCMEIFTDQLQYLLASSKLAENRENFMVHSDQHRRIQPLLQPLLDVLNELVTGPCKINQSILNSQPLIEIFQIITRIVDAIDEDYIELKHSALILILSLTEGFDKNILEEISIRVTPSILMDQIHRIFKKIYVSQLIKEGRFLDEIGIREKEKRRKIELRKIKKKKNSSKKLKENKVTPVQAKMINRMKTEKEMKQDYRENNITQKMENLVLIKNWQQLKNLYLQEPDFSEGLLFDFTFRMVILWQILADFSKRHKNRIKEIREESKRFFTEGIKENSPESEREIYSIFYFIDKILLNIEIVDPNHNHLLVYFPRKPECFMLAEQDKKTYMENCDITDANTKMLDLMRNFNLFSLQMEMNMERFRTQPIIYKITSKDAFALYNKIAWTLGCLINIFMGYTLVRISNKDVRPQNDSELLYLRIMCWLMITFSSFCLISWFLFRFKQRAKLKKEEFKLEYPASDPNKFKNWFVINIQKTIIESPVAMSLLFYCIFTILGLINSYFYISLNLLLIVNISRTAKFVLNSITFHSDQLIITLIMAIFVIFSTTLLLAEFYYGTLDIEDLKEMDLCGNMLSCFVFSMNYGLRNGGGIADSMVVQPKGDDYFTKNIFFDLGFFIIVNVIALNIIFGIIIDTFSQLRDEEQERQSDSKNICFVCGNERSSFNKQNIDFEKHVFEQHYAWNFLYYLFYLKSKGEDELNGLEYFTWTCFQEMKTEWIPNGDTLFLGSEKDDEEQLEVIQENLVKLENICERNGDRFKTLKIILKDIQMGVRENRERLKKIEENVEDMKIGRRVEAPRGIFGAGTGERADGSVGGEGWKIDEGL